MKRKFRFRMDSGYVGTDKEEEIEIEFDDDASEREVMAEAAAYFEDWVWNHLDTSWEEIRE